MWVIIIGTEPAIAPASLVCELFVAWDWRSWLIWMVITNIYTGYDVCVMNSIVVMLVLQTQVRI